MRLKPRTWLAISLLLFAAALCMWRFANKYQAQREAEKASKAAAVAKTHGLLVKNSVEPKKAGRKSYRLSNTRQKLVQLVHNPHAIILRNALIDTEIPVALNIPEHLRAKGAPGSYLVQADRPLDRDFYAELTKEGVSYVSYVPNNAALVQASAEAATNLAAQPDIIAVLPYEPFYKLDNSLLPSAVEQQPSPVTNLTVVALPGQRDAAMAALTALGARLIGEDSTPFGPALVVNVPATSIVAVSQIPQAQEIEAYTPRHLANDLTRVQMGVAVNTLIGTPDYLGLSGQNVIVNMNDTGVDATHPDLGPSSRLLADFPGSLFDDDGHGTHVAGIIAGNGTESSTVTGYVPGSIIPGADFRGKATNAALFVQSLDLYFGPFISDSFLQQNASSNLGPTNLISNNSWGYASTSYDTHAASYDAATRDAQPFVDGEQPLLFVFAAGNSGSGDDSGINGSADTINSPGTAKNVITVGASDSPRFITNMVSYDGMTTNPVFYGATDNSNLVAWFSSCGNVDLGTEGTYGRFKPDVVAPGTFIISCRSTNYVDPTNELFVTDYPYPGQVVNPGQTNSNYGVYLPPDTLEVVVVISSNALSPNPFPTNMEILADLFDPPTDIVSTNNIFFLTNFNPGDLWNFGVTPPTNQPGPVNYDLNIYLYETNSEGDYFTVLSNMNSVLRPYYRYESGTSMSAGAVSGTLALMQEFLQQRDGITNPSPALLKAMLINGSRTLGIQYDFNVQNPGPNEQGWGLPNITNCIPPSFTNGNPSISVIDQSVTNALSTGQYQTYTISSGDTNATLYPIRVTLVWTDPPGDPAAGIALVNNLELTVADASNNVFIGNDFLSGDIFTEASNPTNLPPGQSDNTVQNTFVQNGMAITTTAGDPINNVQNVYINPAATNITFPLTITVSGTRVNVNAVPGQTNRIVQDYALVVSSDDPALGSPLSLTPGTITQVSNVLITVASNGVPLLHERVGANDPNLWVAGTSTNGTPLQWHFFVFTNNQFTNGNMATNVAFATFLPPNLSIPRQTSADIDMYVSTDPTLTNLNPTAVLAADKSVGRTGSESIIYSNSFSGEVYYIGIKSEDQMAADFGFYGIAQQNPFSTTSADGNTITANATALPVVIPTSLSPTPALAFAFMFDPNPVLQKIRRATVSLGIESVDADALYGVVQHNSISTVINSFATQTSGPGFTNTFDDLQEDPNLGDVTTVGPGSLTEYVDQQADGLWLLSEANDDQSVTGNINSYSVSVDLQQPQTAGFIVTIPGDSWFDDFVLVPNDATNMIINVLYQGGSGPVGIYLTNQVGVITTSDYGSNNIVAPGGSLSLNTNNPVQGWPGAPPLAGGTWYYGIYNESGTNVTLYVQIQIQESLTPNLVQFLTNSGPPISLTTDGHTQSQICVSNGQQLVDLSVGLRINDTNLDDLDIQLTSPEGTTVVLFQNRGGTIATNLGLSEIVTNGTNSYLTNYVYTVFTEDTNLTQTPIKFADPPYSTNQVFALSNIAIANFENVTNGVYTNGAILDGWLVTNNIVALSTTNGIGYLTNDEVGIVTDTNNDVVYTNLGTNYLALTSGHIVQTFSNLIPNATYQIQYYARGDGVIHWYPGNDNPNDIIGTNTGTLINGATYGGGEVQDAFLLNAVSNQYITTSANTTNFNVASLTSEQWVNFSQYPTNASGPSALSTIISKAYAVGGPGTFDSIILYVINGILSCQVYTPSNTPQLAYPWTNVAIGAWHHVAFTFDNDSSTEILYIDGLMVTNKSVSGPILYDPNQPFQIGDDFDTGIENFFFSGAIDEVSLYNRALSPAEIYAIYHAGILGKYSTNSILPNFDLTVDGISTNNIIMTNAAGVWQLYTNTFVATNSTATIEFAGNPLGVLLDDIQVVQLPTTNYNNYYLPEEPLTPFIGQNPLGCWTLDVWDTRNDSTLPTNGTLLSWNMEVTTSSTNASLIVLTNRIPTTNLVVTNGGVYYFAVDVPPYAHFATNILSTVSGGPLTWYFDQSALPTGGLPGDVLLPNPGPTTSIDTLSEGGSPPLIPGQRYFMAVINTTAASATFTLEVDFDVNTNAIIALTNAIPFTNSVGTNVIGTNGPEYYSFTVPTNAAMVTFQILNATNGEVDLYASSGLPLPGPTDFDYESRNTGTNDQFIVVTTNSTPVPLPVYTSNDFNVQSNTWYLAAYNALGVTNENYTIIATVVTNTQFDIIPLTNGIFATNTAYPGYPTNLLYSYAETNTNAVGIQFTVTNLTNVGNVELLADFDTFPTPQEFYEGSFNAGTTPQVIVVTTNVGLPSLIGTWYLAVPNTTDTNVAYSIEALDLTTLPVTPGPLVLSGKVSAGGGGTNGFTFTWAAVPNMTYKVYMATNLAKWNFVTNVTPQTTTGSYTDPTPVQSQAERFYKLQQ